MAPLQYRHCFLTLATKTQTITLTCCNLILPSLERQSGREAERADGKMDQLSGHTTVHFRYSDATRSWRGCSGRLKTKQLWWLDALDAPLLSTRLTILPVSSNSETPPETVPPYGEFHLVMSHEFWRIFSHVDLYLSRARFK